MLIFEKATPDLCLCDTCSASDCKIMQEIGKLSVCPRYIKDVTNTLIYARMAGEKGNIVAWKGMGSEFDG